MKEIKTERLLLRQYTGDDHDFFIALFTDENVMKHVDHGMLSREKAEDLWEKVIGNGFNTKRITFAAKDLKNGIFIGHALINQRPENEKDWELGYILAEEHWGKGYATEIAKAIAKFAFEELDLNEIYATVDDDNFASINVLKKTGLEFLRYEYDDQGRFSVFIKKSEAQA